MKLMKCGLVCGVGLLASLSLASAQVQNPGVVNFDGSGNYGYSGTVGYGFTLSANYDVKYLGVWDVTPNALLNEAHDVGIWDSSGALVCSATVPVDGFLAVPANGGEFRWIGISPTMLAPGNYTIGAYYPQWPSWNGGNGDEFTAVSTFVTTAPQVSYNESLYDGSPGLTLPTDNYSAQEKAYFGPNFATPDGGVTAGLLGLALLGIAGLRRRTA